MTRRHGRNSSPLGRPGKHELDSLLGVIDAAYSIERDEKEWCHGITSACLPWLDDGLGVAAAIVRTGPQGLSPGTRLAAGGDAVLVDHLDAAVARIGGWRPDAFSPSFVCQTFSDALGPDFEDIMERSGFGPLGIRDLLRVTAFDPAGHFFTLVAPLRSRKAVDRKMRWRAERVAAHIASGVRARAILDGRRPFDDAEAILSPTGRVEHAESGAASRTRREELRSAVRVIERARSRRRSFGVDEHLAAWEALIAGRWSLIDHFDGDGRRYLVARRNDPDVAGPPSLSRRERQVLAYRAMGYKLEYIAYQLGLSPATVWRAAKTGAARLAAAAMPEGGDGKPVRMSNRRSR